MTRVSPPAANAGPAKIFLKTHTTLLIPFQPFPFASIDVLDLADESTSRLGGCKCGFRRTPALTLRSQAMQPASCGAPPSPEDCDVRGWKRGGYEINFVKRIAANDKA